jgi:hypothetical protein
MTAYRAQADALEIDAGAKHRLADEYDAAQERGEISKQGAHFSDGKMRANEILPPKELHEGRLIRDAEAAEPGIVLRTIDAHRAPLPPVAYPAQPFWSTGQRSEQSRTSALGINGKRPPTIATGERSIACRCSRSRDRSSAPQVAARAARGRIRGKSQGTFWREKRITGRMPAVIQRSRDSQNPTFLFKPRSLNVRPASQE